MPCPGQQNLLASRAQLLANRHHVRQSLTGMMHRRFKIDDRNVRIFCERTQHRIRSLFRPVLQISKRPHTDRHAVSAKHAHEFGDVLSFIRIHEHPFTMLQRPTGPAGLQCHGIPTKFVNANLHRGACAQARIEKDQGD